MPRHYRLCLPIALAIAACQAPSLTRPVPAEAPAGPTDAPVLQLLPEYRVAWGEWPGDPSPTPTPLPADLPKEPNARLYPDLQAIAPTGWYVERGYDNKASLRFSTSIGNAGPGHLQIRGKLMDKLTQGTQEIVDATGQVVQTKDVGTFELHPDHGHFHVSHVARYELRKGGENGELVRNGKKISFCMEDSIRIRRGRDESRTPKCSQTMQGITRGFADVYSANLPDQLFDVAGLASGEYTIVIQLDPNRKFLEASRLNNKAWVRLQYDARSNSVTKVASYP
jgi:Lysyl oxidase